jgi:hypothetical protein
MLSPLDHLNEKKVNLKVLSISGTPKERKEAGIVLDLLESGRHTMLVVLLLGMFLNVSRVD